MMNDFFETFVLFTENAVPYVITWEIGMLIVRSLLGAVTGRGLDF